MGQIKSHVTVDAKGLSCPMPIVKTKQAMESLKSGEVLEIHATDPGSEADIKAWAENQNHQYLGTLKEDLILKHFLRKATSSESGEKTHPLVVNNDELEEKMKHNQELTIIDVRESAEYAFHHIPNTINIPLGELEQHLNQFKKDEEIYLVCRTGNRSDLAAKKMTKLGFNKVFNVIPGMSKWSGDSKSIKDQGE